MKNEKCPRCPITGEAFPYVSGVTETQVRNLEMRGRAERVIRQGMLMNGASSDEIEEFVAANLPPSWEVILTNSPSF